MAASGQKEPFELPRLGDREVPISVIAPARRLPTWPSATSNLILDDDIGAVIGF
jgi:hypothetical protein